MTARRYALAAIAVLLVGAYAGAPRTAPTVDDLARPGCYVVEHGPTGPEPTVNLGRTVERCDDGVTIVTTWVIATGEVIDVEDDRLTPDELADVVERKDTIRDERRGGRFDR
jgi:hypothetical protein